MQKFRITPRHQSRRVALQALYHWHLSQSDLNKIEQDFLTSYSLQKFDQELFVNLFKAIPKNSENLDNLISPYLDIKIEQLDLTELMILRLACFELKNSLEIPYKVIINEYIELTKAFGAEESHKFINGVLDKLARELRPNG